MLARKVVVEKITPPRKIGVAIRNDGAKVVSTATGTVHRQGNTQMTNLEVLEAAFDAAAREERNAEAAYKRSRSKVNTARLIAAKEAFDITLADFIAARDAAEEAAFNAEVIAMAEATKPYDVQLALF